MMREMACTFKAPPAGRLDARGEFVMKAIGEEALSADSQEWIVLVKWVDLNSKKTRGGGW